MGGILPKRAEGGKLFFSENGITTVRNFDHVVLESPEGYRIKVSATSVSIVSGTEDRPLHVALHSEEIEKLARAQLRKTRSWRHTVNVSSTCFIVGCVFGLVWAAL
jgi:hypothetical protein